MKRYLAVYTEYKYVIHAVADYENMRKTFKHNIPRSSGIPWFVTPPLCLMLGKMDHSSSRYLMKSREDILHSINSDEHVQGQTYTSSWAEEKENERFKLCVECYQLVYYMEEYNVSQKVLEYIAETNIEGNLDLILSNIKKLALSNKAIKKLIEAKVPTLEWENLTQNCNNVGLNQKQAISLYQNGYSYDRWNEMKDWPEDWIKAYA